jgi:endothelin-converting enzyme/putative endopeptidase
MTKHNRTFNLLALLVVLLVPLLLRAQSIPKGIDLSALDRSVDACTDFYRFACGGWVASHPLPEDRQRFGRFTEVLERNYAILRRILETPGGEGDLRKARDYYAACMNEPAINSRGLDPIRAELARINALSDRNALPEIVAHLHSIVGETAPGGSQRRAGFYAFFRFGSQPGLHDAATEMAVVGPDGIGLPSRDYYIKTDAASVKLRDEYRAHIAQVLKLAGVSSSDAERSASVVLQIETSLAKAMLDVAERRDPAKRDHPMNLDQLQTLTPGFNWKRYVTAAEAPAFTTLNVSEPEFMKAVNAVMTTTSVDDLKTYLTWHLVHGVSMRLPSSFNDATFDFFDRKISGQNQPAPRWRECIADTDQQLGEALGKAFVEEAFGAQAKADAVKMVQEIKGAMKRDIEEADWMSKETKAAAQIKLQAVIDRIGYPDKWEDYSSLRIAPNDALGNLQRSLAFHNARRIAKIGKPVDRGEWNMTPPTVNAYYSSSSNNINFPAGILQPPFYRAGGDAATNYGAIGAVVGHELSHGFDDQGRKFDSQGNLKDWWTNLDAKAYEARSSCVADQYSQYVVTGDTHINGRLTLGENTADNGGLRLALMAYLAGPGATPQPPVDGFNADQRFFIGWAQQWCENSRPEAERLKALTNPHSANRYRTNGVVSNMPEFQKAFSCKANSAMVSQNICRVW